MGSAVSNTVEITVTPVVAAPVLSGVLNTRGDQIQLSWTCATPGIVTYFLYKNANNAGFSLYKTLAGTVSQFLDTITEDPIADLDFAAYYLVALTGTGFSGPSNEIDNGGANARI